MSSYKEIGYKGIKYKLIDSLLELSLSEQLDIIKVEQITNQIAAQLRYQDQWF